jgi:hypothetical protein
MTGTYQILGIPDPIAGTFVAIAIVLTLAPYAAGADFGVVKVPRFSALARRRLKAIGPAVLFLAVGGFAPLWTGGASGESNPTWKRNYQLFASRQFPQVQGSRQADDPPGSGKAYENEQLFVRDLRLLVLDEEQGLASERDALVRRVVGAPKWLPLNPDWFVVDDALRQQYLEFRAHLRAAAAKRSVDVEQLEREKYVPPD